MFGKLKAPHLIRGATTEEQAHNFLIEKGLLPVCRNFRCKQGELDLVMIDDKTLVIVEVRYRKTDKFGSALESITAKKQSRIIAATQYYLSQHKTTGPIRFDVIAISDNTPITWIKNAFQT